MPSSYTTSLRLTLPATGENAGTWGSLVNTGITELLDAAVAGTTAISTWGGAGVAYTLSNNSGTADEARRMFIVATGSPGEAKNVICPAVSKFYVFRNDTTGGFALTLKTPSGTGIAVPAGQYKFLYCDGTNVVEAFNSAGALTLSGALSVGGTTTLAGNPTLSAGTANGVTYLNASKVLTSGSALTFDGTNLGVGTSSPASKLNVVGDQIIVAGGAGTAQLGIQLKGGAITSIPAAQVQGYIATGDSALGLAGDLLIAPRTDVAASVRFITGTTPAERMRLDSSGNLGLGVTPTTIVGASGSNGGGFQTNSLTISSYAGTDQTYFATNAYTTSYVGGWTYRVTAAATRYDQSSGIHAWYTAPSGTAGNAISFTQAMTLDASGNLAVGTSTTTNAKIFSFVNDATLPGLGVRQDGAGPIQIWQGSGGNERARITSGGDLLVWTTNASVGTAVGFRVVDGGGRLECGSANTANANIGLSMYSTGAAAYRFYVGWGGTIFATSTTITAISDQRLKENIRDLDDGLNAVMALQPRKFDWKAGKGKDTKNDRGFIAQEFEQVFPDMVDQWIDPAPEGEEPYKAVNADLIPVLVKAIQEQQAIINDLRARVAALEA